MSLHSRSLLQIGLVALGAFLVVSVLASTPPERSDFASFYLSARALRDATPLYPAPDESAIVNLNVPTVARGIATS